MDRSSGKIYFRASLFSQRPEAAPVAGRRPVRRSAGGHDVEDGFRRPVIRNLIQALLFRSAEGEGRTGGEVEG